MLLTALATLTLLLWLGAAWEIGRGNRRLHRLAQGDVPQRSVWPRVTLVFAARNEAATIGAAVPTMLALDYPNLEFIAVNDRSEDTTGEILDGIATRDARLHVEHLPALRPGWLGKNHALHRGAQRATGKWILFTDADVHFAPDTLRRAIAHAEAGRLDHLAAIPQLHERGHLLGICVAAFGLLFTMLLRPWKIPDPHSASHGGVGAFNLVRTATYRRRGGHEPIRLRPDDDLMLGKLMKRGGGRSEFVNGIGALSVAWYANVGELVRGLTKNTFAGVDYRAWMILGGVAAHGIFVFWPIIAVFATHGLERAMYVATVGVMMLVGADYARFAGQRAWHGALSPAGLLVMDYIMLRSMIVTFWQRGIVWRGTHYPLRDLRANRL